ncbi:MAG: hypothetical protein ACK53Y_27870, partial [bacterium]
MFSQLVLKHPNSQQRHTITLEYHHCKLLTSSTDAGKMRLAYYCLFVSFLASSGFIIFTCQRVGRINVIDFMTVVQEQDSSTAFADLRTASVENPEQ